MSIAGNLVCLRGLLMNAASVGKPALAIVASMIVIVLSVIYWLATNAANPDVVVANSLHGYVYVSADAGESWSKVRREFGEIRALAWVPN